MIKGCIRYRAEVGGCRFVKFAELRLPSDNPAVEKVLVAVEENPIYVSVYFSQIGSHEEARSVARPLVEQIVQRLAFLHELSVQDPTEYEASFSPVASDTTGAAVHAMSHSLALSCFISGMVIHPISEPEKAILKAKLEAKELPGEAYFPLLRSALKTTDVTERFLFLYSILLLLTVTGKKEQFEVDQFIRTHETGVPQTPSPHHTGVMETVYSRLRNQIGHKRTGISLEDTRREMGQHTPGLLALVKKAIELS